MIPHRQSTTPIVDFRFNYSFKNKLVSSFLPVLKMVSLQNGRSICVILVCVVLQLGTMVNGLIDPIEVDGKHFVNSVTKEPFCIKGVDYQPGDSSEVNYEKDPLSDPNVCARDILLFQELGINTIRIYSINPDLDHDKCMSMLAAAGLYLILDVNSPLPNQHLNRYEPWKTYNAMYLEHVFKVMDQFSSYDNTLGFFAGNEIVNDKRSAQYSPIYIKALIGDMKTYLKKHSTRHIPIGYSAADDLDYRNSLSSYLECSEDSSDDSSVDFYGVNSYQWCGKQTMESSGYDKLVEAYKSYSKPVFLSEYGCNQVLPRTFDEVAAIHSEEMFTTFSGGLVYEYSQESNNYGLVRLDENGDANLLEDFHSLRKQYSVAKTPSKDEFDSAMANDPIISQQLQNNHSPLCKNKYENLNINSKISRNFAGSLIKNGVSVKRGKFVTLEDSDLVTTYKICDVDGSDWKGNKKIKKKTLEEPHPQEENKENDDDSESSCPKVKLTKLLLSLSVFFSFTHIFFV